VIDCGKVNEKAWQKVDEFRIGERAEPDNIEIALGK
jgi:hypothetical protein